MPTIKADNSKKKLSGLGLVLKHEGFELDPYYLEYTKRDGTKSLEDFPTGGVGHKMSKEDMDEFNYKWADSEKKDYWMGKLKEDYVGANVAALRHAKTAGFEPTPEQEKVLTSMSFQMGEEALGSKWPSFMEALAAGDNEEAYWQMLTKGGKGTGDSKWYNQTPDRAKELAEMIRSGGIDERY